MITRKRGQILQKRKQRAVYSQLSILTNKVLSNEVAEKELLKLSFHLPLHVSRNAIPKPNQHSTQAITITFEKFSPSYRLSHDVLLSSPSFTTDLLLSKRVKR